MATITLTSDFGYRNYITGGIKGCLLTGNQQHNIVDISHEIEPFNFNDALYIFGNAYQHFPAHTWHLLFVNVFYRPIPQFLLAWHKGHYFAAPDNGLLPMVLGDLPQQCILLPMPKENALTIDWTKAIGQAIEEMEKGTSFHELGEEPEEIKRMATPQPALGADYIEGHIIFIDRFENVVINIRRNIFDEVGRGRQFSISLTLNEKIEQIHQHYGQVREGDKLAFFNQSGYLEIAINKGNAAGLFGLRTTGSGSASRLNSRMFYERVRIHFFNA